MGKNRIGFARCVDRPVHFNLGHFLDSLRSCFRNGSDELFGLSSSSHPGASPDFGRFLRERVGVTRDQAAISLLGASLLSKFDDGDSSSSTARETAAFQKWRAAEEQCLTTNVTFANRDSAEWRSVQPILFSAARKISRCLGDFCWNEVSRGFAFGPGATTRLGRKRRSYAHKFSGTPETTLDNLALAEACIRLSPRWYETSLDVSGNCVSIRNFNKVVTVPKNWKTDRVISIEPCMNIFVQKGIGAVIRSRLHRVGIDLNDQTKNQRLAREGSMTGRLATIDLSSASDTISYELVKDLLPEPWFTALEQCRTPSGVLPSGEMIPYQKFSSMGNGYTFELESLIFWALAEACRDAALGEKESSTVSVYGDDIIIDVGAVPQLLDVLKICGFTPNPEKSWWSGRYRESCGKHYLHGVDVTPFFIRKPVRLHSDLFLLHNNLYRWAERNYANMLVDHQLLTEVLSDLRELASPKWRKPRIPDGFGDGAFIGTFDECVPKKAPKGWDGFLIPVLGVNNQISSKEGYGCVLADLSMRKSPQLAFGLPGSLEPFVGLKQTVVKTIQRIVVPRSAEWPYLHKMSIWSGYAKACRDYVDVE